MLFWPVRWLTWLLMRAVFAGRYKVKLVGKPEVLTKPGPYLTLPNHVALCDPPNLLVHLWPAKMACFCSNELQASTSEAVQVVAASIDMPTCAPGRGPTPREAVAEVIATLKRGENDRWPAPSHPRRRREAGAPAHRRYPRRGAERTVVLALRWALRRPCWADGPPGRLIFKSFGLWSRTLWSARAPRHRHAEPFTRSASWPTQAVNRWLEEVVQRRHAARIADIRATTFARELRVPAAASRQ